MDIFLSKDEKLTKLDKKLASLEKKFDRKFEQNEENFRFFKGLVLQMQDENRQLKKDRDYLLSSYKSLLDRLYDSALSDELRGVVEPMRSSLKENFNLMRNAAKEGLDIRKNRK